MAELITLGSTLDRSVGRPWPKVAMGIPLRKSFYLSISLPRTRWAYNALRKALAGLFQGG